MEQNINEDTNWKELFSLYRDLVGPFQEFENRVYHKWDLEQEIEIARETINFGYKKTIQKALVNTLKWSIPFLGVFYIFINVYKVNGERLSDYWLTLISLVEETMESTFFNGDASVPQEFLGAFIELVLPCPIFLLPLMIAGSVISRAHKISKAKKTLKTCAEVLPQAETAVQKAWKGIAPYIEKVPQDYRNSQALAFFSNSFFNFKVRNLQEAVNLYDEYLHQQRMEQGQREIQSKIAKSQRETMAAMDALYRQMDSIQDQISSLY